MAQDSTHDVLERARSSRDARFDGRFFIGVKTTGIYCRPICRVRLPAAKHVEFFTTAAAAEDNGFRPCHRCRPESAPGTPAWQGVSTTVARAMKLISEGALDQGSMAELVDRLGIGERHLNRLFSQHLGTTPLAMAQTRRLQFAKQLIDGTALKFAEVALSAGYPSVRRFNAHVKQIYGKAPRELRRKSRRSSRNECGFGFKLAYRPPFDWTRLLEFHRRRAVPGVESVGPVEYRRTIRINGEVGQLTVVDEPDQLHLCCNLLLTDSTGLLSGIERLKNQFDLYADPLQIDRDLSAVNSPLRVVLQKYPGIRVPGCWDPFEVAVRAIVGQQISVAAASTVMGRIVDVYGEVVEAGANGRLFPGPEILADLDVASLPMPMKKAETIRELARCVNSGQVNLREQPSLMIEQLVKIAGIGPWTAQYIAMRAGNDPDAFLHGDLVLLKAARKLMGNADLDHRQLDLLAEEWRPWRAYLVMMLWQFAGDGYK